MPDIYRDLNYTADQVDEAIQTIGSHVANNAIHVNQSEKDSWNAKADSSALSAETSAREAADTALQTAVNSKADASALTSEISARETADASINSRISAIETDQQRQETEIAVVAAMGAKNLFPITAVSQTIGGVTFTVNGDGTVTANGTKTNNDWFILSENNSFDANTYTLSDGLPNDTTDCQLIIATARSMSVAIMTTAVNSRPQTKTFTTAQNGLYYAIRIASGKTVNNLTFKPMIRRAEITDDTYTPYAPTNRELYEMILALQSGRYAQSSSASLMQAGRLDSAEQTNINDTIADSDM